MRRLTVAIILYCVIFWFVCLVVNCATKPKCMPPVYPIHGSYKQRRTDYIPNDEINYSCNDRTFLYGTKIRKCLDNGTWDGTSPYCATTVIKQIYNEKGEALQSLTDGNYSSCSVYKHPKELAFSYNGKSTKNGILRFVWKALEDKVETDKFVHGTIFCQILSKYRTNSLTFNEYMCTLNTAINYTFNIPAVGRPRNLCEIEIFTKRDDICPQLSIDNGFVRYNNFSSVLTYGNAALISCKEGYTLSGEIPLYCSDGGKWLGNNSCEKVRCDSLKKVKNGNIVYQSQTYLGIAKLHCDEGYVPTANTEVTCQLDGKWAIHDFNCTLIDCGNHSDLKNGIIRYSNTTLHGIASLHCDKGYRIVNENSSTCLKNTSWSYANFECKEVRCYKLPKLKNGEMWLPAKENLENATVGTKTRIHCQPGFTKTHGQLYIECLSSGNWSTTNVTCRRAGLSITKRKLVIIAASVGAVSSAVVFTCVAVCILLLRRRLKRKQQSPDNQIPLNEIPMKRTSLERHEYSCVVYEEIQEFQKLRKKPTSPLPKIPSTEIEFDYSIPIDQKKDPYENGGSNYNYMEPDDAYKTECSSLQTKASVKRRNSSADSSYWRDNDILKDICDSDIPKMRKMGSNTSLPDFPANRFSLFENDLYSSD